jgi:hypothetical protein
MFVEWTMRHKPALFMTIRRETAQSLCETGARSREGERHT